MQSLFLSKQKRIQLVVLFVCACFWYVISTTPVYGAVMQVDTEFNSLHVGDVFTVQASIDTQTQTLNAVETTFEFPRDILEFVSSDTSHSVVTVWMRNTNYRDDAGTIDLAGITPGGFTSDHAPLLDLTFKVLKEGQGIIDTKDTQLLLHDGKGTPALVTAKNLHISVVAGASHINVQTVDDEQPEPFAPTIAHDADVYDGKNFVVFATTDKGSGIDHFEIKEGLFGRYVVATSPYLIQNQLLDRKISVKAIDHVGNERIEIIYPQGEAHEQNKKIFAGILIPCVLILLLFFLSYKKRQAL